jgi:hypothetical protein
VTNTPGRENQIIQVSFLKFLRKESYNTINTFEVLYTNKNEKKKRITTLSQQFQNLIEKSKKEATINNPNTYIHLTWLGANTSRTSFEVN